MREKQLRRERTRGVRTVHASEPLAAGVSSELIGHENDDGEDTKEH
jgi:hypothetical protein